MRPAPLFALCVACSTAPLAPSLRARDPILAPLAVDPAVQVESGEVAYTVHGATPREARDEMNRRRPVGSSGPFDALTTWSVSWHYPHLQDHGSCRLGPPRVAVTITTTLPRWEEAGPNRDWQRYFAALREHERGHAQNARAAGQAVLETLRKVPPSRSCGELDEAATRESKDTLRSFNAEDAAYDHRTRHGETQGAIFP